MIESTLRDVAAGMAGYLALGIPFLLLELLSPRRAIRLRSVVGNDLLATLSCVVFGVLCGRIVGNEIIFRYKIWEYFEWMPRFKLWAKLLIMLFGSDFTLYWVHRAMHTRLGWPTHRWHHSTKQLYWLPGVRASLLQSFFFILNPMLWAVALQIPGYLIPVGGILGVVGNHWQHCNLRVPDRLLGWFLVTPTSHEIHHSRAKAHHNANFGSMLTCWDRLFGTRIDPSALTEPLETGIPEEVSKTRLAIGI